jgi:uncharacterized RDD family membrane protein YckC
LVLGVYLLVSAVRFLFTREFHLLAPTRLVNVAVFWGAAVILMTTAWSTTGRTLGKQMVGLRVVRQDRQPLSMLHAFLRAILYTVFLPGFVLALFSRRRLSVQDYLVGSEVVYDWSYRGLGA